MSEATRRDEWDIAEARLRFQNLVRDAVESWPQFDAEDGSGEADVNGADLVDWFAEWRRVAKRTLEEAGS